MKLKRNLILLIVIINFNYKSFSQTDTKIVLTENVAKLVVKDLVTYDGLSAEYKIARQTIATLEGKVITLQDVINNIQSQLDNRNNIIEQKDVQIENYINISDELKKALKRERRNKKLYKIGSAIGLAFVINNMISK